MGSVFIEETHTYFNIAYSNNFISSVLIPQETIRYIPTDYGSWTIGNFHQERFEKIVYLSVVKACDLSLNNGKFTHYNAGQQIFSFDYTIHTIFQLVVMKNIES